MAETKTHPWSGAFADLNPTDQLSVAQLVKEGGAVIGTVAQITTRLKKTQRVALLREDSGRIVGVAALKTPNDDYRADKFATAGIPIAGYETAPELGYVVTAKDMRGRRLSGGLVDAIAQALREPAFATTDSDTMKNNLSRASFTRVGTQWPGERAALSLWIFSSR